MSNLREAIESVTMTIERELISNSTIDTKMSGTTMTMAVIRDNRITICNVGDSRAVLGTRLPNGKYVPVRLSRDHKPDLADEMKRINENGGMVCALQYANGCIGPSRVWLKNLLIPGLAMSRSLGDRVAHMAGVVSTPEVCFIIFIYYLINEFLDWFANP